MLLQPDPRSPNRLQRFACSCFSPSKTNPDTSYLGLFVMSVSILKGAVVKSELLAALCPEVIQNPCWRMTLILRATQRPANSSAHERPISHPLKRRSEEHTSELQSPYVTP